MTTDTNGPQAPTSRRRRPWAAFLLNCFLPPMGYIYAGSLRAGIVTAGLEGGAGLLLSLWTFSHPPGVYGFLTPRLGPIVIVAAACLLSITLGLHAALLCRRPPYWQARGTRVWLMAIGVWAAVWACAQTVRWFAPVAVYSVSSRSMAPTLSVGDFVWTSGARAFCGGQRVRPGDAVILRRGGQIYISRAIAGPDQVIALRAGRLSVDGKPAFRRQVGVRLEPPEEGAPQEWLVVETLADGASYTIQELQNGAPQDELAPTRVRPASWFVLGDNRDNSLDSRFVGDVREDDICGVAREILYSRDAVRIGARP